LFVVQCSQNDVGTARLGMAVSTKNAGNSVSRNRIRRLIRESFRMHRLELPALDFLVTARPAAASAENRAVFESLSGLWQRVKAKP
jgi:ribonuclease P protein component